MRAGLLVPLALCGAWGCVSTHLDVRAHPQPEGHIRYAGALAGPYKTFDQMVETACERMKARHTVGNAHLPPGYCAGYFHSPEDNAFFFSHVTDMVGAPGSEARACTLPRNLLDPDNTREFVLLGGASPREARTPSHWRPTQVFNQTRQRPHDNDLLLFSLDESGTCAVHGYESFPRVLTARQDDDRFIAIGKVRDDGEAISASR